MAEKRPVMAALMLDALDDILRVTDGLEKEEAEEQVPGFSPISWTLVHTAQHIDSWVNGILARQPKDSYLSSAPFSKGATGGGAEWNTACASFTKCLKKARTFLETVTEIELAKAVEYQGSMAPLRGSFVTGNYRLARLTAHIYYHIGEIATIRGARGRSVTDFPGPMPISSEVK